jgi:D-serine deaminase-like pyridoxal phosphate-dependent protein
MASITDQDNPWGIQCPTLLLDTQRARRNIMAMAGKARQAGVFFRPHFKSHQSAVVGQWFRECGVTAITVSSLSMAEYFANHGWRDLTVAFPVNLLEMDKIQKLAARIELGLLVDSLPAVEALARSLQQRVKVWLKVDTGYRRTGVGWNQPALLQALAIAITRCDHLELAGLLTHSGHSYQARSRDEILSIHRQSVLRLLSAREVIESVSGLRCKISVGDTPTCSLAEDWAGVDEIRPGNFVFFDVMQLLLGSCRAEDIAVAVACPVIGKYEQRRQIVVYGGAVHLAKESTPDPQGRCIYGYLTVPDGGSLGRVVSSAPVVSLSQEHGVIDVPATELGTIEIGDIATILPVHSCLTCALYRRYLCLDGREITRM